MTDLARKRAIRVGHRGVITKLTKKADSILDNDEELEAESSETRLQTINIMLSDKLKIVKELDEQVLSLCEVEDISREIEEADDIISRVFDVQTFIAESRRKSKLNVTNTIEQDVVTVKPHVLFPPILQDCRQYCHVHSLIAPSKLQRNLQVATISVLTNLLISVLS